MSELPLERVNYRYKREREREVPSVILYLEASACWFPLSWKLGMLFAD
jgi:hypothetical protein